MRDAILYLRVSTFESVIIFLAQILDRDTDALTVHGEWPNGDVC